MYSYRDLVEDNHMSFSAKVLVTSTSFRKQKA